MDPSPGELTEITLRAMAAPSTSAPKPHATPDSLLSLPVLLQEITSENPEGAFK